MAAGFNEHGLKAGVYHADVDDAEKQGLHRHWREGNVKIVVATVSVSPSRPLPSSAALALTSCGRFRRNRSPSASA